MKVDVFSYLTFHLVLSTGDSFVYSDIYSKELFKTSKVSTGGFGTETRGMRLQE